MPIFRKVGKKFFLDCNFRKRQAVPLILLEYNIIGTDVLQIGKENKILFARKKKSYALAGSISPLLLERGWE